MSIDSYQERKPQSDGAKNEGQSEPSSKPVGVIVDPQGNPYRHTNNPYQKLKNLIKRVLEKIPHGERMMILLTAAVAFATFAQAGIAWYSSHSSGKIQMDQFNQMKSVADRMEGAANSFAGNSANINQHMGEAVNKLDLQAGALKNNVGQETRAANAAASAAKTARDTLRISERAYIFDGPPQLDLPNDRILVPLVNGGHILSGKAEMLIFERTHSFADPTNTATNNVVIEQHWRIGRIESIPIGSPYSVEVNIPKAESGKIDSGEQGIIFCGIVTYNDGFSDGQQRQFCESTNFNSKSKHLQFIPADTSIFIPEMKRTMNYPAENEWRP